MTLVGIIDRQGHLGLLFKRKMKSFLLGGNDQQAKLASGEMRLDVIWTWPKSISVVGCGDARLCEVDTAM